MNSKNDIQKAPTQETFDIRPAAVKIWVENLPLGSTGETSKQIYRALRKVNHQNNSISHHLEFLDAISPTLASLQPRLFKYFIDVSLPLNKKTRNVIHVTSCLLNEILSSYQIVIKTLITKKPFGWKKPLSLALHHNLIYTSQILCSQRLVYQPYNQGVWRDIFSCYKIASKLNLLNKSYQSSNLSKDKTSIDYEFKRLLLLSLLSANDLGLKNMEEVHNLMPLWIKHAEILTKEPNEKTTCFTLNLLSDNPPYLLGTKKGINTSPSLDKLFLSTQKLKKILTNYLAQLEADAAIRIGKNVLSKPTIESLLSSWSRNHLRAEVRQEGAGFVDIITGISAIHFILNQQDQPAYDEVSVDLPDNIINFESTLTMEPEKTSSKSDTLSLEHFLSSSDQEEDIWGSVYENTVTPSAPATHWTETGTHKTFNFSKSILLDYSKEGYRLSINDKSIDSLKHNELVAVREHALAPWSLAQVKWLHFSKIGDVQLGIHILSHHVLPINIKYSTDTGLSKPLPCLLGLDKKKLMLFIPTLPTNLNGKKLELEHQNQRSQIDLKNKFLSTPAFDIYEIHEPQIKENSLSKNTKQTEVIIDNASDTKLADSIWSNF